MSANDHFGVVEVCRRSLTQGELPEVGGVRPHVTIVVSLDTLQGRPGAAPAMLDRLGPVCGETARPLACDAGLTRVITDGASQPLDVGREQHTVSPANAKPWPSATAAASAASWEPPGFTRLRFATPGPREARPI